MVPHSESPVWIEDAGPRFPPLESEVSANVCVIGLGGSGLSCLAELNRLGLEAVGVDAATVGGAAAGRNAGVLLAGLPDFHHRAVARFGRERAVALYRATLDQMEHMAAETPDLVRRNGSLRIAAGDRERRDCWDQYHAMKEADLPVEWYEGEQGVGLLITSDGVFQPMARCQALARGASAVGTRLFEHSPVKSIQVGRVITASGVVRCDRTIVAVDGALERVLPELRTCVRSGRVQMLATAPERQVRLPLPVYTRWGYDFWWQLPDGRVLMGGKRDAGGLGQWTTEPAVDDEVQRQLNYQLRRLGVTATVMHRWAGVIGFSDTRLPIFREVRPGVLAIGAYSGTGNVMGALLGREAARWAADGEYPVGRLLQHGI